jgi:hypothetical protein
MFPYGEEGYSPNIPQYNARADRFEDERNVESDEDLDATEDRMRTVTARQSYAFRLQF